MSTAEDKAYEQASLVAHNKYRALHGAPPLKLNPKLTEHARMWAKTCLERKVMEHSDTEFGENIFWASNPTSIPITPERPVEAWYQEINFYDFDNPKFEPKTGHFTQLIWAETTEMGVGVAIEGTEVYVVANYNKPGNVIGQFEKNVPRPTSSPPKPPPVTPPPAKEPPKKAIPLPAPPSPAKPKAIPLPAPPSPAKPKAIPLPAPPSPAKPKAIPLPAPPSPAKPKAIPAKAPPAKAIPLPPPPAKAIPLPPSPAKPKAVPKQALPVLVIPLTPPSMRIIPPNSKATPLHPPPAKTHQRASQPNSVFAPTAQKLIPPLERNVPKNTKIKYIPPIMGLVPKNKQPQFQPRPILQRNLLPPINQGRPILKPVRIDVQNVSKPPGQTRQSRGSVRFGPAQTKSTQSNLGQLRPGQTVVKRAQNAPTKVTQLKPPQGNVNLVVPGQPIPPSRGIQPGQQRPTQPKPNIPRLPSPAKIADQRPSSARTSGLTPVPAKRPTAQLPPTSQVQPGVNKGPVMPSPRKPVVMKCVLIRVPEKISRDIQYPIQAGLLNRKDFKARQKSSQTRPSQARPSQARPSQARPSQARPSQARPSQARPNLGRPSQTRPNQARPKQARPNQRRPSQATPNHGRPSQTRPNQVRPNRISPNQGRMSRIQVKPMHGPPYRNSMQVNAMKGNRLRGSIGQHKPKQSPSPYPGLLNRIVVKAIHVVPQHSRSVNANVRQQQWGAFSRIPTPYQGRPNQIQAKEGRNGPVQVKKSHAKAKPNERYSFRRSRGSIGQAMPKKVPPNMNNRVKVRKHNASKF